MKCHSLFSGRNKKNIINLLPAEFADSMLSVKTETRTSITTCTVITLTLKVPIMTAADDTFHCFVFFFFIENKSWHYMWIICECQADDSHEMSWLIFSKKKKKKINRKIKILNYNNPLLSCCGQTTVKQWRNLPISYPKPDLLNINACTVWLKSLDIYSSYCPETKFGHVSGR